MEELHKKNRTGKEYFYMIIKKYNSIKKIEEIYDELYNSLPKKHAFQSLSFLKQTDTLYYKLMGGENYYTANVKLTLN